MPQNFTPFTTYAVFVWSPTLNQWIPWNGGSGTSATSTGKIPNSFTPLALYYFDSSQNQWLPAQNLGGGSGSGGITQLLGDVLAGPGTGSVTSTVVKVNGGTIPIAAAAVGTNGSGQLIAITALPPTGAAGGDLSGTYPNPTVAKIQSIPVSATGPTDGQVLQYSSSLAEWLPVDFPASASGTFFLDNAASPIGGGYLSLITSFPTALEQTAVATGNNVSGQVLAGAWASGYLNATVIAQGMWTPSIYAAVDSLTQTPQMVIKFYTRTTGGVETLQATLTVTLTATAVTLYTPTIELGNIDINVTDVLVLKIYLQAGGSSTRTLTVYYDGNTHASHIHTPTQSTNVVKSEPVNSQSGTTYTFLDSDRGKLVTFSNTAAVAGTLPQAGASSLFLAGWFCDVDNYGNTAITITPTTSTINGKTTLIVGAGEGCRIVSDGTNYYTVRGNGNYQLGSYLSGMPNANQVVGSWVFLYSWTLLGNCTGSIGKCGTNPTATATYNIQKNYSNVGTVSISTSGIFTFTTTSGLPISFAANDLMTLVAPNPQDTTLANVQIIFLAIR